MIPERSIKANSAKSVFFEEVNDIDIYIEDTAQGYAKLFEKIFKRVFDGKYKVNKIFPLGGRKAVIDEHTNHASERPSLYIIDGDLWMLNDDGIQSKKGLYALPAYCIENILCDHNAISYVLEEEDPDRKLEEIVSEFKYEDWLPINEELLFSLFIEYATSIKLNPTEKTVSLKVSELVSGNKGEIDSTKITNRINEVRHKTIAFSNEEIYNTTKSKIILKFNNSNLKKIDIVSGKDYLFPLLKTRAKSIVKTKLSDINFKIRLAKNCSIEKILNSKEYVLDSSP